MPSNYHSPISEVDQQRSLYFHSLVKANKNGEKDAEISELLAKHKGLVSERDANGFTPLQSLMNQFNHHGMTLSDLKKTAGLLAKHGADLTCQDSSGARETYLHRLVLTNANGVNNIAINALLEENANNSLVNVKNGQGLTPLQVLLNQFAHHGCKLDELRDSAVFLIVHGGDLTVKDATQARNTLLHILVQTNKDGVNDEIIGVVLEKNKSLCDQKNGYACTPLQSLMNLVGVEGSTIINYKKIAMMLVSNGASLTVKDSLAARNTLLHHLVLTNKEGVNDEEIHDILESNKELCNVRNAGDAAFTPVECLMAQFLDGNCSLKNFKNTLLQLAKYGANFRNIKHSKYTHGSLMSILISKNDRNENDDAITKILELRPELVDQKDFNGMAPLQFLIDQLNKGKCTLDGFKKTAQILIMKGAEPSLMLHTLAATNKNGVNDQYIKDLVGLRNDLVHQKDKDGRTPLQKIIFDNANATIANVKLLVDLGGDIGVKIDGKNLLHAACSSGNFEIAKKLEEAGLEINKLNIMECFPQEADEAFWNWLRDRGANIHATDISGRSLLHYAADNNNIGLATWLIEQKDNDKVNLNVMNENAETALNCAEKHHYKKMAGLLLKAGARVSNLNELYSSIKAMSEYGVQLKKEGEAKGDVVIDLASELSKKASQLMRDENINYPAFKKGFSELLNSKNDVMSEYRIAWNTILKNIFIALTGVGAILLVGKLAYTKATTGRALCFFQKPKTTSEGKIEQVNRSLSKIGA